MQILYLSSLGETLLTIYNLRFTKQVYKKQYEHPNLPSNAFNIVKVKIKVKRFIGQPQGTGLTNYNTKDKETERKMQCTDIYIRNKHDGKLAAISPNSYTCTLFI